MCGLQLSMKKLTGAQDVFDSKVLDNLLSNFNEKYAFLHSILQTLLVTDQLSINLPVAFLHCHYY